MRWLLPAREVALARLGDGATVTPEDGPRGRRLLVVRCFGEVEALAGGRCHDEAGQALVHALTRPEGPDLSAREVASVLGVSAGRVRQLAVSGRLRPVEPANRSKPLRFEVSEVYGVALSSRKAGT